ncbi:MAG: hypothetical protein HOM21_11665, partial [Halobacteriovoraceae bacterium]|nr:hypothetical protein [Halobacteriovoraceae bacterium]
EICEDAKAEGVDHLEIRFGPALHLLKGLVLEEVVDAALEGANNQAGLILCGMYGDDPKLIEQFVEIAKTRNGVVAIDMADGPHDGDTFDLKDYAPAYLKAKDYGIHRTVHASEGRSPKEIITAVRQLHAERLGHATTLLEDPEALELVLKNEVTIESCPTSNLQCGVVPIFEEHPVGEWLDKGVRVCLNTDNTLFSQVTSYQEHLKALKIANMDSEKLLKCIEFGHLAAFSR